jgi:tRNA(Ile)-lysidine synthase
VPRAKKPANSLSPELKAQFAESLSAIGAPWPAAVGVSGGSDSLALMGLLADWAQAQGLPPPLVFCVDHGLRAEAKVEAKKVVAWAKAIGLKAYVLSGEGKAPANGVEAYARQLRYRLMGEAAKKKKLKAIYVAHTEDDQAETFLLRLARGSGVDGLSGMRTIAPYPDPDFAGLVLARPLLSFSRAVLRNHLKALGQDFIDDPMNADPRFARVRIRQAWPELAALGLTPTRLSQACSHLSRARGALEVTAAAVMSRACQPHKDGILLDPDALREAPKELALRTLAHVLMLVSANPYRPRFERLASLFAALSQNNLGGGRTLHGCHLSPAPKRLQIFGKSTLLVQREKKDTATPRPTNS